MDISLYLNNGDFFRTILLSTFCRFSTITRSAIAKFLDLLHTKHSRAAVR